GNEAGCVLAETKLSRRRDTHLVDQARQEARIRKSNRAAVDRAAGLRDVWKSGLRGREHVLPTRVRVNSGSVAVDAGFAAELERVVVLCPRQADVACGLLI